MFELLISVSGVGAKSAIAMLSEITPSKFALDVVSDDITSLTKIPGVGKKTAARIILELKDKLNSQEAIISEAELPEELVFKDESISEAIAALQMLGYHRNEIEQAFLKFDVKNLSVEEIIRKALSVLGR